MDLGACHVQAGKTVDTAGRAPRTKAAKAVANLQETCVQVTQGCRVV